MKSIFKLCLMLIICNIMASCSKDEVEMTGSIYGITTDADNGEPVRAATVSLSPGGLSATTGSDGAYEFPSLNPGQYTVQIAKNDYQTNTKRITVVAGQKASGDLQLNKGVSKIKLSTNSLNFGTSNTSLTFSILNVGTSGTVSWNISKENLDWLSVSPTSGTTAVGKSSDIIVNISREKISENVEGVILVNSEGASYSIIVNAEASSGQGGNNNGGNGGNTPNLSAGLVAYYTFNNEDAKDATDNALHASLINSPEFTEGVSGKALFLNGIKEQYMNIPYNPFQGLSNYSVTMWVKDFGSGVMFSAISNDYERSDFPRLIANQNGSFTLYTNYDNYNSTTPFSYQYKDIQDGNWHMISIVCTQEGNKGTKYLFIDNRLVDTSQGTITSSSNCTKIHLGGNGDGKYTSYTSNMKVDNVRIYNKKLEASDIEEIYTFEK